MKQAKHVLTNKNIFCYSKHVTSRQRWCDGHESGAKGSRQHEGGPNMKRAKSPVIVTDEVKEVVTEGGSVIVECLETVSKKGTAVVGQWGFYVVTPDTKTRRLLVLKLTIQPEITRTALGVMSKLMSWGLPTVALPTQEGQAIEVFKDGSCSPLGDSDP